jgi:hypothetical protein
MLAGNSMVTSMSDNTISVPEGIGMVEITSTVELDGNGYGSADIDGPTGRASGRTVSGGAGVSTNNVKPTTTIIPGATDVAGTIEIDTKSDFSCSIISGNFAPVPSNDFARVSSPASIGQGNFPRVPSPSVSPGLTGGRAGATGIVTVESVGIGNGPSSVNSANTANIFSGSKVVAANQFGSAGGLGSGIATAASLATGLNAGDPLGVTMGTGTATGNFDNSGSAAFALPPGGPTSNSVISGNFGNSGIIGTTRNVGLGATTNAPPSWQHWPELW